MQNTKIVTLSATFPLNFYKLMTLRATKTRFHTVSGRRLTRLTYSTKRRTSGFSKTELFYTISDITKLGLKNCRCFASPF